MTVPDSPVGDDDLQARVDGRLSPERQAVLDAYLAAKPEAAVALQEDRDIRDRLRLALRPKFEEPIPSRLRLASIRGERRLERRRVLAWAAAACLLLIVGGGAGWIARDFVGGAAPDGARAWVSIAEEGLSAHRTFSPEIVHPVEVKANEEAHLTQWLSKRLRRRLIVPDLDAAGYDLVGGRLLPAGADVAALLMYADRAGARLTLYVRCGAPGESAMKFLSEGELSSFSWQDDGLGYVVSAAMAREKLQSVARLIAQDFDLDAAKQRKAL